MSSKIKFITSSISRAIHFINNLKCYANCQKDINCNYIPIEQVDQIKYLVIFLDSQLTWKTHIAYVKTKLIKYIKILYILRCVCDTQTLKSVYNALVNSLIKYGISV